MKFKTVCVAEILQNSKCLHLEVLQTQVAGPLYSNTKTDETGHQTVFTAVTGEIFLNIGLTTTVVTTGNKYMAVKLTQMNM